MREEKKKTPYWFNYLFFAVPFISIHFIFGFEITMILILAFIVFLLIELSP